MVDTIYLESMNFELRNMDNFYVYSKANSSDIAENYAIGTYENGSPAYGYRAELKREYRKNHLLQTQVLAYKFQGNPRLLIKITSLPKILYLSNLFAFDETAEYGKAFDIIWRSLQDLGILIRGTENLKLRRVDLAHCIVTERAAHEYLEIFKQISYPRMMRVDYPDGVEFRTKSRSKTLGIYDKTKQMLTVKDRTDQKQFPSMILETAKGEISVRAKVIRIEFRFKTFSEIRANLKIGTLSELINNPYRIRRRFRQIFQPMLDQISPMHKHKAPRNYKRPNSELDQTEIVHLMKCFARKHKRTWFNHFIKHLGMLNMFSILGDKSLVEIETLYSTNGKHKSNVDQISRIVRGNKKLNKLQETFMESYDPDNFVNLIRTEIEAQVTGYYCSYDQPYRFEFYKFVSEAEYHRYVQRLLKINPLLAKLPNLARKSSLPVNEIFTLNMFKSYERFKIENPLTD